MHRSVSHAPSNPTSGQPLALAALLVLVLVAPSQAAGTQLYGVHWWDYDHPTAGDGPTGGWSVETVVTDSAPWWQAPWFVPLYEQVTTAHSAEIITRIDYDWGQTVPAPDTVSAADWAARVLDEVVAPLGPYAHRWIIGNEPNITGEAGGWPSNQITPAGYAQIYHTVRQAIKAQRPGDEVLFAPVSPGGVIPGVRWRDGNQWLAEAIDATLAIPGGAIDGFAIHAYGNPFVGAAPATAEFHQDYTSQLAVIGSRSLHDVPVYLTEWNRSTDTTGDLAANEQVTADFIRLSLADVDAWNRTPGNHNIRALAWFVDHGHGGWENYSLQWWSDRGNPPGHPGDLRTALLESSHYLAGLVGTRPWGDYNGDGVVDVGDWHAWRAAFGRIDDPFADGNRNGVIDAADYTVWRDGFRPTAVAASAPVPEPPPVPEPAAYCQLLVVLAVAISARRRTSRVY